MNLEEVEERRERRHAEYMKDYPERHQFAKDSYTRAEASMFCYHCWEKSRHLYEYHPRTEMLFRKLL